MVLLGSGLGLLAKAGVGVPGFVLAGIPVIAAVLVGWSTLKDRRRDGLDTRTAAAPGRS